MSLELNRIYSMDCLDGMKLIPQQSVDVVLTDPPYKMNHSTGGCTNIGFKNKWLGNIKAGNTVMDFSTEIRFSDWLPLAYSALKHGGHAYIFVNDKNMQEMLNTSNSVGFRLSNILVWHKNNCTPNRYYMKNCEFILFLYKGHAKPINNMNSKCVMDINNINGKQKNHPTEKPTALLEPLIINSTNDCGVILDPFMGSGSTAIACINTKRNYIGFETSKEYCDIAEKRIASIAR